VATRDPAIRQDDTTVLGAPDDQAVGRPERDLFAGAAGEDRRDDTQ
jgi:hypothetical protein